MRMLMRRPCRFDHRRLGPAPLNWSFKLGPGLYYLIGTSLRAFECMARAKGVQESLGYGYWWSGATLWSLPHMNLTPSHLVRNSRPSVSMCGFVYG